MKLLIEVMKLVVTWKKAYDQTDRVIQLISSVCNNSIPELVPGLEDLEL